MTAPPPPMLTEAAPQLALEGIRVLDFSRVLAGPFCGSLLGDMGADVIKIEDTDRGDESRTWLPQKEGQSAAYLVNNRNKRGIAVNLKTPEGVAIVKQLAADADVLIENFRTGTMDEFGLGFDVLAALNPRLVYCSITAFGRTGPRARDGGYEALMQAFSGIMSITGEADGAPVRSGVSFIDLATGSLCAFGIVNALMSRARSGRGQRVDGALLDTAIGMLNYQAQSYLLTGEVPRPMGSAHPAIAPYRNYRCADGHWVFVAGANDGLTRKLLGALGLAGLCDDPRYATNAERVRNRVELDRMVSEAIARHDRDALLRMFEEAGFPASPVNSVAESLEDPQTRARAVTWPMDHPVLGTVPVVRMPVTFSAMQPAIRRHAPRWGEHTDATLAGLAHSPAAIAALRERKIVR
ncbi:MAG: CoA transferase [Betaproteobacteria bacterium]|nr:CoA transferase [Betaproteobacteria bacterium]